VQGRKCLYELCNKHSIAHKRITKIISAATADELRRLDAIFHNGKTNGVDLRMLTKEQALQLEPHIRTVGGIFSPRTGIISAHELMEYYYRAIKDNGGTVHERCMVTAVARNSNGNYEITVNDNGTISTFTSEIVN